jgi:hypothetical protein
MRIVNALLLAALAAASTALAQEQERKLIDRIMKPDMTLESTVGRKSFGGGKDFAGRSFTSRGYYSSRTFSPRAFETRATRDTSKTPVFGKYAFRTPEAVTTTKLARESGKGVDARTVPVEAANESGRDAALARTNRHADRPYLIRGKSQDIFDQRNSESQRKLSIDDVRELLNKSQ